jgi:hypothetical protein
MRSTILAIDPGPEESAYVIWDGTKIQDMGKVRNCEAIRVVRDYSLIRGAHCVIEQIASYGMAVGAEVFETCVWTGRFMEVFGAERCNRVKRLEVKLWLCHDSKAKDANIRAALIDRFGGKEATKKGGALYGVAGDIWAALAVALTFEDKYLKTGAAA